MAQALPFLIRVLMSFSLANYDMYLLVICDRECTGEHARRRCALGRRGGRGVKASKSYRVRTPGEKYSIALVLFGGMKFSVIATRNFQSLFLCSFFFGEVMNMMYWLVLFSLGKQRMMIMMMIVNISCFINFSFFYS